VARLSLVEARGLLKWSQGRLAQESDLKVTAISDIETGRTKNPGYTSVMRIIAALQRGGLVGLTHDDVFPIPDSHEVPTLDSRL
jgi:transcriptional regulator with XRE-family HTH domain